MHYEPDCGLTDYDDELSLPNVPSIPPKILFGSALSNINPDGMDQGDNDFIDNSWSSLQEKDDELHSEESSWEGDIIPFMDTPTLFPYHISSGTSFHGRYHSNSTLSSGPPEPETEDLEAFGIAAWPS